MNRHANNEPDTSESPGPSSPPAAAEQGREEADRKMSIRIGGHTLFRQARSPFFTLRVMFRGRRRQFSLGESTKAKAQDKARTILADLKSRGLDETIKLHSRRVDRVPADPTVDEFEKLYQKIMAGAENPPAPQTQARYIKSLNLIVRTAKITRIQSLTPQKIEKYKTAYIEESLKLKRDKDSVRTSLNSILRNAAALFSRTAMAGYQSEGVPLENPFLRLNLKRVAIKQYSPLSPKIIDDIWKNCEGLRDGDRKAHPPEKEKPGKRDSDCGDPHPRPSGAKRKRWTEPDWSQPHPSAYLILLLEVGLGLRRHESDKAEWDWIIEVEGRRFVEVKRTPYFVPKSGESRVIPLDEDLFQALIKMRGQDKFIVPGRQPRVYPPGKHPKNLVYRCDKHHRVLAKWLRKQGLNASKPCHTLRKQFGSYVATSFGLFAAQKFLGHSSPKVTSDYYAGLTDLPEIKHHQLNRKT